MIGARIATSVTVRTMTPPMKADFDFQSTDITSTAPLGRCSRVYCGTEFPVGWSCIPYARYWYRIFGSIQL